MQKSIHAISNWSYEKRTRLRNGRKPGNDSFPDMLKHISYPVLSPTDRQRKEFYGTISSWSENQRVVVEQVLSVNLDSRRTSKTSSTLSLCLPISSNFGQEEENLIHKNNKCTPPKTQQDKNDCRRRRSGNMEKTRTSVSLGNGKCFFFYKY